MKYLFGLIILLFSINFVFAENNVITTGSGKESQNIFEQKSALTEKQRTAVIKKIANKSQLFYSKLLEKVEEAIEKTKNEDLKAKLAEVRDMIMDNLHPNNN